jgi:hypothetical protein
MRGRALEHRVEHWTVVPSDVEPAQLLVQLVVEAVAGVDFLQELNVPASGQDFRRASRARWKGQALAAPAMHSEHESERSVLIGVVLAHLGGREPARRQGRQLALERERLQQLVRQPHPVRLQRVVAPEEEVPDLRLLHSFGSPRVVLVRPGGAGERETGRLARRQPLT